MKSHKDKKKGFSTRAIHVGAKPIAPYNAIMPPVFLTSTFVQSTPGEYYEGCDYSRAGNPTRLALEKNLASLEGGTGAVCFASGCAAIDAVLHLLSAGDHVVCCDDVYGGTYRLFTQVFAKQNIDFSFVDLSNSEALIATIKPETKLIWLESPTNPLLKLLDIKALGEVAKRSDCLVVVDNTFASPYLQQPLRLGADLVLHSSTKYLGGHSDVIGGVVIANDEALVSRLKFVQKSVGAVPSPFDCYLLLRSVRTLALRMDRHIENAQAVAEYLEKHNGVEKVIYPGLESHPQHALAKQQMEAPGGMVSVYLKGGLDAARKMLENVEIFSLAESLGGVESLIEHPAIMTHASIPKKIRDELGITDGLIRLSIGVEDKADLLNDLESALS